jgi:hypothetical protein
LANNNFFEEVNKEYVKIIYFKQHREKLSKFIKRALLHIRRSQVFGKSADVKL